MKSVHTSSTSSGSGSFSCVESVLKAAVLAAFAYAVKALIRLFFQFERPFFDESPKASFEKGSTSIDASSPEDGGEILLTRSLVGAGFCSAAGMDSERSLSSGDLCGLSDGEDSVALKADSYTSSLPLSVSTLEDSPLHRWSAQSRCRV
ncbi:tRNA(Ile)-lysidine synthetase, putative [Babesia ovata]|uniref:tRNA(Ile)-lysidine synthetase, putative n=1 Tax=Babesia ovata TaxID=189622 RepID=A0A2H6KHX6_9APIC|nr:tRNA(Ile)-lysidine synthetase, putative [Babesia ovata]GBE62581.1 tRNA(Ile)-lysidine synthetase, putative [Babesia ovata]